MEIIRQLTLDDLDNYIEHLARHLPEPGVDGIYSQPFTHGKPIEKENFRKTIQTRWSKKPGDGKWEVAWGLFANGIIVGHLELIGSGFPALSHRAKLGMGIESPFRKKGFGQKLLDHSIQWAVKQDFIDYIDLNVFSQNKVAISMYEKVGFKKIGKSQDQIRVDDQSIDDLQYCLNLRGNFPPDFKFEACDRDTFYKVVGNLHKAIFDNENICAWPDDFLSEIEKTKLNHLNANYLQNYTLHTLLFHKNELAGWSMGFQNTKESFIMTNSALLPKFRGRSLYSNMLDEVLQILIEKGFQKIQSYHLLTNNKIILTKLKKGFVISGLQVNDLAGTLVELTYYSNQKRKEIVDFRTGMKKASPELKIILKL